MLLRTTSQKIIFVILAVLILVNTGKDWFDFSRCGAAAQCLSDAGILQLYLKFSMSLMLTILAFVTASRSFSPRDSKLLRLAFVFSLLADFGFSMIKAIDHDAATLSTVFGIGFFMCYQTVLIYRHSRVSDSDKSFPKVFLLLVAALALGAILMATGILGLTMAIVVAYAFFVIISMVVGILAPGKGYFPKKNAQFVRWGVVAFFFGDVLVGLSLVTGDDGSALQTVASVANNFIWWVYVPAQLMLIRATTKPQA